MADNIQITPGTGATIAADDVGGVLYQRMKLIDGTPDSEIPVGTSSNPIHSIDETNFLLRRLVKLMESQATVDSANRQRIAIDAAIPAGTATIGAVNIAASQTLLNLSQLAGADHRQFIDIARTAYNTGIRSKLTFS